jgi:hypothetical protein
MSTSFSRIGQFAAVDEILTGRENLVLAARLRRLEDAGRMFGVRAHRNHARPGARVRREPTHDSRRQRDPRPVGTAARRHRHPLDWCLGILIVAYALATYHRRIA